MPVLKLKHCIIHNVDMDEQDPKRRIVELFVNEEDVFEMLDSINPKNIIKYLDQRHIPHRDALQINVKTIEGCLPPKTAKNRRSRAIKGLYEAAARANKKLSRAYELQQVYDKNVQINDYSDGQ